jgi:hypothetical protein
MIKPQKGMKIKNVLLPKKTMNSNDGLGEWEVVETKRASVVI